ncbi:MAG TPA: NRDE family protein [Pyrinomonadaceae bacterium]|nr:NRDE family protein [Pyrinomonadaceae bacterium]
MCVIFFAYQQHSEYPLILLANRDEFYERPTAEAHFWQDAPNLYAGRDLVHGGTWLGITKSGRFAAVTNYRDPNAPKGKFSRGDLVSDFLRNDNSVEDYLKKIQENAADFSGFNLLVGEFSTTIQTLGYYSNREDKIKILAPGIYGLSNYLLDTPWRKVSKGKAELTRLLQNGELEKEQFWGLLSDKTLADDADLPNTGIGFDREKLLSAIFIETPIYGTRSSSVVLVNKDYEISLEERNFH